MKFLRKFNEANDDQSKLLSEEEFLNIFRANCKNFSLNNDQLYRLCGSNYPLSIFTEKERVGTFGNPKATGVERKYGQYKGYAQLFQQTEKDREKYPVLRTHSLIGSTDNVNFGKFIGFGENTFLVIPFDGTKIVFSPYPDLAFKGKNTDMTDKDFIMKSYEYGFRVPREELEKIDTVGAKEKLVKAKQRGLFSNIKYDITDYGFEFFTNGPALLVKEDKIDWLRSIV